MRTTVGCGLFFLVFLLAAEPVSADIIGGSVLRSPPQYQSNSYYGISENVTEAFPFQVIAGGQWLPDCLDVPLSYYPGDPGYAAVFWIYSDVSGQPGSRLATFPITGITTEESIYSVAPSYVAGPLQGGATYWLVGSSPAGQVDWNLERDVFSDARWARRVDGGDWVIQSVGNVSAFAIEGSAVPEPSGIVLLGVGAVSLLAYARQRRARQRNG
jgi:hypothetical protein